ncbi:MAG TPA: thioredoxin family protein [Chitinophagaceae bacterium]|nr:thioredoxin family protein [Chitinophagaceae bacterium]HMU59655.1 thioredoxin family protein [Chitinophagaceae bacterium]
MKRFIIYNIVIVVFWMTGDSMSAAQDGIQFEHGTWSEVLSRAKETKRPIFIDVYTSWCGPCKKMAKDVFPLKEVGDKFNTSFINYKIDAEKGEGVEIAKKFKVASYPTYLFVSGDEILVYRSLGSMPAEKFLAEASIALSEYKDPKPLAAWEDEYEMQKSDTAFLRKYLFKRKKLRLNSADIFDQYFAVMGKEAMLQSDLLPELGSFMTLNTDGPFYSFLAANTDAVKQSIFEKAKMKVLLNEYLVTTAKNDVDRAIANNDEKLLNKIAKTLLQLPADEWPTEWRAGEVKMKYYTQTKNPKALIAVLNSYGRQLVGFDKNKLRAIDSAAVSKFDSDLAAGKLASLKPENIASARKARAGQNSTSYAYKVREAAKSVFGIINDKVWLNKALQWMNTAAASSDNFTIDETKAGLLYKLGKKKEALQMQQKAIDNFMEMLKRQNLTNDKIQRRLEDTLQKMKEGKPTWGA